MDEIAAAVFLGNIMTVAVVWACTQFYKHDHRAPWLAYAVFFVPLAYFIAVLVSSGEIPPQFDAVGSR